MYAKNILSGFLLAAVFVGFVSGGDIPPDDTVYTMIDGYWDLNQNGGGALTCWSQINQFGHGPPSGDDTWFSDPGGDKTWGDSFDRNWVQFVNPNYGVWDLGKEYEEVVVNLNQDHGPYPAEGLEYKVWGCNNLNLQTCDCEGGWVLADLDRVYKYGWSTAGDGVYCKLPGSPNEYCNDDFTAVWDFNGLSYRYVKIQSTWNSPYDEPEVDVVKGIEPTLPSPEFGSLAVALAVLLTSPAFAYLLVRRRK